MHTRLGMTLAELVVLIFVLTAAAALTCVVSCRSEHDRGRVYCMSNLSSINKGLIVYKAANDDKWPWLYDTTPGWETMVVGTNRNVDPYGANDDPNNPKARSITALMFMLVRCDQSPYVFRCPSDVNSGEEDNVKADGKDGDVLDGEYYWDFAKPEHVSYSWQAPISRDGRFAQGINGSKTEMVIVADMTPRYEGEKKWTPIPIDDNTPESALKEQISHNHKGENMNVLRVAGNVSREKRPDVGVAKDNIYTACGKDFSKCRSATSIKLSDHVRPNDTFLIGPVGRAEKQGTDPCTEAER